MASLSQLKEKSVAVTGIRNAQIFQLFSEYEISVQPWGSFRSIAALIVGEHCENQWKYKEALRLNIPILRAADFEKDDMLWVDRYAPKQITDIIGNPEAIRNLGIWLKHWTIGMSTPKGALVSGPPGIGKTTLAHLIVKEYNYDIVELNASNERSATAVKRVFEEATKSGYVGRPRVVIMDEVDGMSSGDRGGIGELARMIRNCSFPILCIANDRALPKMRPLVACCLDIRCSRPTRTLIAKRLLTSVVIPNNLSYTQPELEQLCEANGNDIRQILNFLQFSSLSPKKALVGNKDELQRVDIFSATGRLFGAPGSLNDRLNLVFVDFGMIPLMVAEGYIGAAVVKSRTGTATGTGTATAPLENVAVAAGHIGLYDIMDRCLRKTMNWSLLPGALVNIVGAAAAANGPAPFQIFPSWLGKNSKRLKHRRMLRGLRGRLCTTDDELDTRDVLRARLFTKNREAKDIVTDLVEYGLTRDDMLETLVETVFTGDEDAVKLDTKTKGAITREWKKRGIETVKVCADDSDTGSVVSDDDLADEFIYRAML